MCERGFFQCSLIFLELNYGTPRMSVSYGVVWYNNTTVPVYKIVFQVYMLFFLEAGQHIKPTQGATPQSACTGIVTIMLIKGRNNMQTCIVITQIKLASHNPHLQQDISP